MTYTCPINIFLAEELAHAYVAVEVSEIRQRDVITRMRIAIAEVERLRTQLHAANANLETITNRHNRLAFENEHLQNEFHLNNDALRLLQRTVDRYRTRSGAALRRRMPPSFDPILRRVRAQEQQRRTIRRRLTFEGIPLAEDNEEMDEDDEIWNTEPMRAVDE